MSKVTNIIIATSIGEDVEYLVDVFKTFTVKGAPYTFDVVPVNKSGLPHKWYGGTKYLEANLFIGAYNHLDLDALLFFMRNEVKWEYPDIVQLIVKEESDIKFRIIDLTNEL